jgi:hypothetical protein
MLAGIITENEHTYNHLTNTRGKYVRLIADQSYQPTSWGAKIWVQTFVQLFDADGKEKLVESKDSVVKLPLDYTNDQINELFTSFNDPINPEEKYTDEFKKMLEQVLLQDTTANGMFGGDNCFPYVPAS